jgi:predicted nucleic acid-binding protein
VVIEDPDDDEILACALAARADAMTSGDRHLLALKSFRGIPILSPSELLEILERKAP